jgi:hypothetical protein
LELGDLDPEIRQAALEVIPSEAFRELSLELVAQGHRIMIVEQDEMIADRKLASGSGGSWRA